MLMTFDRIAENMNWSTLQQLEVIRDFIFDEDLEGRLDDYAFEIADDNAVMGGDDPDWDDDDTDEDYDEDGNLIVDDDATYPDVW